MSDSDSFSDLSDSDSEQDPSAKILKTRAKQILKAPTHDDLAVIVRHLMMDQENPQYKTASDLFDTCVEKFPNRLCQMLLRVYLGSYIGYVRFLSIYLLSKTLEDMRDDGSELSLSTLRVIKPLLVSCLISGDTKQSDINILRRIVSSVAYNVIGLDDNGWDELRLCILGLVDTHPRRAFHIFHYLPANYGYLIFPGQYNPTGEKDDLPKLVEKAKKFLSNPEGLRVQDWNLAFLTLFKVGVLFPASQREMNGTLVMVAKHLVSEGKVEFLERGLDDLNKFLAQDGTLCEYDRGKCTFVVDTATKIAACYKSQEEANEVGRKMLQVVEKPETYIKKEKADFDRDCHWCDHLKNSSPMEIFRIFASTDIDDWSREMAIRVLNEVLSDHTLKKGHVDISVMRQLQPLLITRLNQQGISHSVFQVLGQVVSHVAYEMMSVRGEPWDDLREHIVSQSQTEFDRAVYIFQCLLMPLKDEFVIPVIGILLPEITKRLNSITDDMLPGPWVLAFTGSFCAIIHLMKITSYIDTVKEIENNMIDSVRQLVERRMEAAFVRQAFRDVESMVKKQLELFGTSGYKFAESVVNKQLKWLGTGEYEFLKRLLRKVYEINGMTVESKMALERIYVIL